MEYIRSGRMKPWQYRKEQLLGAPVVLNFSYKPRPVRLVGTCMDAFHFSTSLRAGLKVYARSDDANVAAWVPLGNPSIKVDVNPTGSFQHYLDERDKFDEAWISGKCRLK